MDVKLSEEQVQLRDTARKFLTEACTPDFIREIEKSEQGYAPGMWRQMSEMGWLGIGLPEACGGLGMSTIDMVILMTDLGRRSAPPPFFPTVCIAAEALARAGRVAHKAAVQVDGDDVRAAPAQDALQTAPERQQRSGAGDLSLGEDALHLAVVQVAAGVGQRAQDVAG